MESLNQKNDSQQLNQLTSLLKDRLSVLSICLSRSWGGLEQVAASDAEEVAKLGLTVSLLCLEGSPIHEHLSGSKSVKLLPIPFSPRNYFDFKLRADLHKNIQNGINLIHTHQTTLLGSIVPWVLQYPKVALLATRHIMNDHDKRDFLHQMVYSRVDALMVISKALKQNIVKTHPIRENKVKVVNLGLDFDVFNPHRCARNHREAWGIDPNTLAIGLVGRIDPAKGQAPFIQAAAGLISHQRTSQKLKFVIVGEETLGTSGEYLAYLKNMVAQFGLQDHVIFAGFQKDIPDVMKSLDIFVMPSRQEAFGLVAIEAMAMECPVIISKGGSSEEIVGHHEFGLTVRPNDAFDLQRQLKHLIDHPDLRVKLADEARKHVLKNYDRKTRVAKILGIYHRSLRRRRWVE